MSVVNEAFADGVYTITLNRPEKKNPMNLELLQALFAALEGAEKQAASIVVIRGAGKAFCAGGDIVEFKNAPNTEQMIDADADWLHKCIRKIRSIPAVVVAVVEGMAFGAGLSLSLACDLTLAEKTTIMNMAYRRIGLTPDGGGSIFLPRLVGMKRFNEFYLLSRNIGMEEAERIGMVNFVVPEEEIEGRLASLLKDLRALPQETTAHFKELVNRALFFGLDTHLDKERLYVTEFAKGEEFTKRLAAFVTKKG